MKRNRLPIFLAFATFKNRLVDLATDQNRPLIDYLIAFDFNESDRIKFPTLAEISSSTNISTHRIAVMITSLYDTLLERLNEKEQVVSTVSYLLIICFSPEDEKERLGVTFTRKECCVFNCELKVTPRVGEEIQLPFVDGQIKYNQGYVYDVKHVITGKSQVIEVYAHPFNNPYENELVLKNEYEEKRHREMMKRLEAKATKRSGVQKKYGVNTD